MPKLPVYTPLRTVYRPLGLENYGQTLPRPRGVLGRLAGTAASGGNRLP